MCIHFNNRQAAVTHLTANGWKECATGRFISQDGACAAQINPKFGEVVLVQIWEMAGA